MIGISKRQREVFVMIDRFIEENGYSPSMREIAAQLGMAAVSQASSCVDALEQKGYLARAKGKGRTIRLLVDCVR